MNIFLGMIIMYFIINIITLILLIYTQWELRERWKKFRFVVIFFLGVPLIILELFEDEF